MENSKDRKKHLWTAIGVAAGFLFVFFIKQLAFNTPSFNKAMMQAASEVNKSCPVMVDQETRLDNAVALPGNIFQYNYTLINLAKDSIDAQSFEDYMKPVILNNVKTNPDLKVYRDNKVTMAYNYKDKNGVFITKISVSAKQYED